VIIEKLIISDFYYVGHFIGNIIIDKFKNENNSLNKKNLPASFCRSMTNHQQNESVVIPSMIEFILPIKLTHR
jgi:hypothetical protein